MRIGRRRKKRKISIGKLLRFFIVIIIVIIVLVTILRRNSNEELENEESDNIENSSEIIEVEKKKYSEGKNVENFIVTDINIEYILEETYFTANVTNNGNDTHAVTNVIISLIDKDNEVIQEFTYQIPELKNGESTEITMISVKDYTQTYDVQIRLLED